MPRKFKEKYYIETTFLLHKIYERTKISELIFEKKYSYGTMTPAVSGERYLKIYSRVKIRR